MDANNPFNASGSNAGSRNSSSSTDRDASYISEKDKEKRKSPSFISSEPDGILPAQEKDMSFGEPLHVSVSRGTERFQSIQRTYSKPLTVGEEEEMAAGKG
ncbi:hypothetical protein IWW36_005440, partial [Coemansia brasiliensis]